MLIPTNSKDLKGLKDFLTNQRSQACSTALVFTGPIKTALDELVAKIDAWLAKLPAGEVDSNWCLDNQLDTLFNLLAQASACSALAGLELSKATNGESMQALTTAEIGRRVTAGELFTKDQHDAGLKLATTDAVAAHVKSQVDAGELVTKDRLTQLCSESKLAGFGEGETKVRTELAVAEAESKVIVARKALVQAASLPLPEAEIERIILGGTEEQFNARMALFKTRQEALKTEGIQLNADAALANLWLEEGPYTGFKKLVGNLPQLKFNPNPLAIVPGDTKPAAATPVLIV